MEFIRAHLKLILEYIPIALGIGALAIGFGRGCFSSDGAEPAETTIVSGSVTTTTTLLPDDRIVVQWLNDSDRGSYFAGFEIFVMNADGTQVQQLTDNWNFDGVASWSPDKDHITFQSDRDGDSEIFVMNAEGMQVRQLTESDLDDRFPAWSPDGGFIAFGRGRDTNSEIFVMNADGTQVRQLTDNDYVDEEPTWSPDGEIGRASCRERV